jgi:hypothetical protein
MKDAKVFISYSIKQTPIVQQLRDLLTTRSNARVLIWSFDQDLPFGDPLWTSIENCIEECDHFLLILSDEARNSESVQRELGMALRYRRERNGLYPTIIGVRPDCHCDPLTFIPRDPLTLEPSASPYNFGEIRYLSLAYPLKYDEIDNLIDQLLPKITFLDSFEGVEGALFYASIPCYETLFPDVGERDHPEDIQTWFEEIELRGPSVPWRELYTVLHLGERVIGMAYISTHASERWSFGNYLGVLDGFRHNSRAQWVLKAVSRKLREMNPGSKGVLFEVDPINMECLREALRRGAIAGTAIESDVIENFRRLRRIVLYRWLGAYVVLDSNGNPLPYWQPAMSEPLDATGERQLILMFLPDEDRSNAGFDTLEAIRFIYDKLYKDAYGGTGMAEIAGFNEYVQSVRRRVEEHAAGSRLGEFRVDKGLYVGLSRIANHEGIGARLDL